MNKLTESDEKLFLRIVELKKIAQEKEKTSKNEYYKGVHVGEICGYSDILRLLVNPECYNDILKEV